MPLWRRASRQSAWSVEPYANFTDPLPPSMERKVLSSALLLFAASVHAQFQLNPQLGVTFQNLTDAPEGVEYRANVGFLVGLDARIGDALYVQPGAFFGRSATTVTFAEPIPDPNNPGATITTEIEDGLVRSMLKMRAMLGYKLVNKEDFKLRLAVGPSYDVLLSVDDKNDRPTFDQNNFNDGTWNLEAGFGMDVWRFSFEPGVALGLSRVYRDNPVFRDIDSKYFTFYFTAGLIIGKGMQ